MSATRSRTTWIVAALALAIGGAACKKAAPPAPPAPPPVDPARVPAAEVKITEVQLGSALGADKRVAEAKTAFATKDTIFASVATEGTGNTEVAAKWTFQDGQVVNETKKNLVLGGKEVTEFSIQKPDGWPAGTYKVEISLNGKPADSKSFTVQ
jgi:hypothetical protein